VLLNKPGHLAANITADFQGFVCPDKFVVGYGMDMAHQFRELPFVGHVISEQAASAKSGAEQKA
jgi:hypoxanthine phosphoribosyltransferase